MSTPYPDIQPVYRPEPRYAPSATGAARVRRREAAVTSAGARSEDVSILRLPIFWLFLGPPIIRMAAPDGLDSVQGTYDFWNFFQAVWWLLWGAVALRELYLHRSLLSRFIKRTGSLPVWTALWMCALLLSCLVSPAPMFSMAKVCFLGALVLSAADLSVKVYAGNVSLQRILTILLGASLALLALVSILFILAPSLVIDRYDALQQGMMLRSRGGRVAYTPIVSIVVLITGLYFLLANRPGRRWPFAVVLGLGALFLALGQTRSAYVGFGAALLLFVWRWKRMHANLVHLLIGTAFVAAAFCIVGLTYDWFGGAADAYDDAAALVIRDDQSISTMTGRTQVWTMLWKESAGEPLGMGFSAGPRTYLLGRHFVAVAGTDAFGNAHSAYMEVLAGSGVVGFLAWMAIVGYVILAARHMRTREMIPFAALLVAALIEGITESMLVMPFYHTAVLFWIAAAVAAALRAGRHTPTHLAAALRANRHSHMHINGR